MADLEKSVAIIFEGVDQMGAGVDSATKKLDSIAGSVESATQPMADLTLGVLKFEGALLAAGSAVTAFSIKLAGDFDSQFREIATLIDAPSESLEGFRSQLRDYGSDSTQTLEQVNSAVYSAISAGVEYTDSLDAVRQAEQLAVAGRADLDQSLTVLVSSLNAYGEGMDEAERYSDLLFQTVRSGQTTLPELGASLAQVTSTAANAGVSFDELLAAVASITAGGAPTSQAVTQVRAAISSLIKPTADAASLAEELGLEFNASALESKGLEGVLREVEEATGGNVEQIGRLFSSQEALNGALALSGDGAERFAGNLADMENSAGATEAAYEKMADSVENGTQRIQNAMQGALIGIGDPLLNEFGGIQEAIAEIFNAIGASVEGGQLSGFVDELEGLFQGIETTLRDVARNLPDALEEADFSSFFDGIEAIREAVASLFEGADLTSADGLASVIETLGLGFEALAQYTAGAIEGIGPFLEQLASLTNWFLELDPALFAAAGAIGGVAVALNTAASAVTLFSGPLRALVGSGGLLAKATPLVSTLGAALG
ncbi:MAG: phage tail tape measure protein, partial [Halomonas sp.]